MGKNRRRNERKIGEEGERKRRSERRERKKEMEDEGEKEVGKEQGQVRKKGDGMERGRERRMYWTCLCIECGGGRVGER